MADKFNFNVDDVGGFKIIGEMSTEELMEELIAAWRVELSKMDSVVIKRQVIALRMSKIRERMIREAGLKETPGFLGFPTITEDDD